MCLRNSGSWPGRQSRKKDWQRRSGWRGERQAASCERLEQSQSVAKHTEEGFLLPQLSEIKGVLESDQYRNDRILLFAMLRISWGSMCGKQTHQKL